MVMESNTDGGLREQNKRDKFTRIMAAARKCFGTEGYEATTMRNVARVAGVGAGTVFSYAPSKEDLLVLVFKMELEPIIHSALDTVPDAPLLQQFLHVFNAITEHHAENIELSKPFLKHLIYVDDALAAQVAEFNWRWLIRLVKLVEDAKLKGEIEPSADSILVATCCRLLFISQLRSWISALMSWEAYNSLLSRSLELVLKGVRP